MRHILCLAALVTLAACNKVDFSEHLQEAPLEAPQCMDGESLWLPGGTGRTQCPNACPDGSYLQCVTNLEKEIVCAGGEMSESGETRVASIGAPIGSCPVPPPPPETTKPVTEEFDAPMSGKADLLVVLDTTPSMFVDLNKLSQRFKNLTSSLEGVDWQVAITNAGASGGWVGSWDAKGEFFKMQDHPENKTILKSTDDDVDWYFQLTVGRADDEERYTPEEPTHAVPCNYQPYCMASAPKPLEAVKMAIDLRDSKNKGFFRKDAWLVPLIISDADENEDGKNGAFEPKALKSHFDSTLGSMMRGVMGFGIVVKPGDKSCLKKQSDLFNSAKYGTFVDNFANMTGGLTMSICDNDYSKGLKEISQRVSEQMSSITLSEVPVSEDIQIKVTPAIAGLTWTRDGKKITFSKPIPGKSKIKVTYKVKK